MNQRTSELVGQWHVLYPWLDAGVLLAVGEAGVDPRSDQARQIALLGADARSSSALGWDPPGTKQRSRPAPIWDAARLPKAVQPKPEDHVLDESKVQALGKKERGVFDAVWSPIKRSVQSAFALADFIPQFATGVFREDVGDIRDIAGGDVSGGLSELGGTAARLTGAGGLADIAESATGQDIGADPRDIAQQTDIGAIGERLFRGQPVDAGHGFFIPEDSKIREDARRAQLKAAGGLVEGHIPTPGRLAAGQTGLNLKPDSTPYNLISGLVDGAALLASDPLSFGVGGSKRVAQRGLKAAGDIEEAKRLDRIAEAGGFKGLQKQVDNETAAGWLVAHKDGRRLVDKLVEEKDFYNVFFGTGGVMRPETALRISKTKNREEILDVLFDEIGLSGPRIGRQIGYRRPWQVDVPVLRRAKLRPGFEVDLADHAESVRQMDRMLANVNMPVDQIRKFTRTLAEAPDVPKRRQAFHQALYGVEGHLVKNFGVDPTVARRLTRYADDLDEAERIYDWSSHARARDPWSNQPGKAGSDLIELDSRPVLWSQIHNPIMDLPDARALRRMSNRVNQYAPLLVNPKTGRLRGGPVMMQTVFHDAWKVPQLALRPLSWMFRELIDEQGRLAAINSPFSFRHPFQYIAGVVGGEFGALDDVYRASDEFARSMARGTKGLIGRPIDAVRTGGYTMYRRDSEFFPRAMAHELGMLHADPAARTFAETGDLRRTQEWFWNGPGQKFRKDLAESFDERLTDSRQFADDYIRDRIVARVQRASNEGNESLLDVIRTGRLDGERIMESGTNRVDRNFLRRLEGRRDVLPERMHGPVMQTPTQLAGGGATGAITGAGVATGQALDRATEAMFSLVAFSENVFTRSQAFRGFYWNRLPELVPFADDAARTKFKGLIEKAGKEVPASVRQQFDEALKTPPGQSAFQHVDEVARLEAADGVRRVTYDFADRGRYMDSVRLLAPFGVAWREFLKAWVGIIRAHPAAPVNIKRGVEEAEEMGVFYENEHGEMVFGFPGSGWLNEHSPVGLPVPFVGRAQGLNLGLEILPGAGPLLTMPAEWILEGMPIWDKTREVIAPYGAEGSLVDTFLPSYMSKLITAASSPKSPAPVRRFLDWLGTNTPERQAQWASTRTHMMRTLASTGKYDHTPEDQKRLVDDAERQAMWFYASRGFVQSVAPASPAPTWFAFDKDGEHVLEAALQDDYQKKLDEDPRTATSRFLEEWGEDMWAYLVSPSEPRTVVPGVTKEADKWLRSHGKLRSQYPEVIGLFAPQTGEWDFDAAARAQRRGEVTFRTSQEYVEAGAHMLGATAFRDARESVGPKTNAQQRAILREYKDFLKERFRGYDPEAFQDRVPGWIEDLSVAVHEPKLAETDGGQGLRLYLEARNAALRVAQLAGLASFNQANAMLPVREELRVIAAEIIEQHPRFEVMWTRVFERELADDTDE